MQDAVENSDREDDLLVRWKALQVTPEEEKIFRAVLSEQVEICSREFERFYEMQARSLARQYHREYLNGHNEFSGAFDKLAEETVAEFAAALSEPFPEPTLPVVNTPPKEPQSEIEVITIQD